MGNAITSAPSGLKATLAGTDAFPISGSQYGLLSGVKALVIGAGSVSVASGKTLTVSKSITLDGTDSTTMTFPTTSATLARTDAANTFTGHQTIEGVTSTGATGTGKFVFDGTPTLVTPVLGVATGTSLALGGATIGSNALAVTGLAAFSSSGSFSVTGTGAVRTAIFDQNATSTGMLVQNSVADDTALLLRVLSGIPTLASTYTSTGSYQPFDFFVGGDTFHRMDTLGNFVTKGSFALGNPISSIGVSLSRLADANLRIGKAPSATPVAQILTLGEASRGGTDSNVSGASGTIQSGLGTGTGTVSKLILQVPVLGSSGTTAQTYGSAVTVNNSTATGLQFNGYGAGAITSDGSGNLTAASDPRMKNIQRAFTPGLAAIRAIRPIVYKWKPDSGMDSENEYAGFDAQNVRDAIELATWQGKDGLLSLQDRALLAACINAVNELAGRIH